MRTIIGILLLSFFLLPNKSISSDEPTKNFKIKRAVYKKYFSKKSLDCLAKNVYFEARNQSLVGKLAVANVVINRVRSGRYPSSVCEVIHQSSQFSWYGRVPDKITDKEAWERCLKVAIYVLTNEDTDNTRGATHYHEVGIRPKWIHKLIRTIRFESHIFYRMKT